MFVYLTSVLVAVVINNYLASPYDRHGHRTFPVPGFLYPIWGDIWTTLLT